MRGGDLGWVGSTNYVCASSHPAPSGLPVVTTLHYVCSVFWRLLWGLVSCSPSSEPADVRGRALSASFCDRTPFSHGRPSRPLVWKNMFMDPNYGLFAYLWGGFFVRHRSNGLSQASLTSIFIMLSWQWLAFCDADPADGNSVADREQWTPPRWTGAPATKRFSLIYTPAFWGRATTVRDPDQTILFMSIFAEIFVYHGRCLWDQNADLSHLPSEKRRCWESQKHRPRSAGRCVYAIHSCQLNRCHLPDCDRRKNLGR